MGEELRAVKEEIARLIVRHLTQTDGAIATPGDDLARVRREVLRGLRSA